MLLKNADRRFQRGFDYYMDEWHRPAHLSQLIGDYAWHTTMLDIDCCEYCDKCKTPIALIETTRLIEGKRKTWTVTKNLAKMAGLPAYLVEYSYIEEEPDVVVGISEFRVTRSKDNQQKHMSEIEYAEWLRDLHMYHVC